jgi:hypothetical protein
MDRVCVLAQQTTQVIGTEIGIPQDAGEGAFAKLLAQRHDEAESVPGLLEPNVAAALSGNYPSLLLPAP